MGLVAVRNSLLSLNSTEKLYLYLRQINYTMRLPSEASLTREVLSFIPSATKLGQGNIFRSVCQEFCSHPGAMHAGRYGQQAGGTHPTGMHTCKTRIHSSRMCTVYRIGRLSGGVCSQGVSAPGGCVSHHALRQKPPTPLLTDTRL